MSRRRVRLAAAVAVVLGLAGASIALASGGHGKDGKGEFRANLIGFREVPPINTPGRGRLRLSLAAGVISFRLEYRDLTGPPLAAHIHVGQRNVNGGVSVFFCGGGGKPACPSSASGTVSGTIGRNDVLGPTAQGFEPRDLAALQRAIRAGVTYANMHTAKFPGGEIRGQIRPRRGDGHH